MEKPKRKDFIDRTGHIYGRLTVISYAGNDGKTNSLWNCVCLCGNKKIARSSFLRRGEIRSCGCLQREFVTTHSMTGTPEYRSWNSMKARCFNKKSFLYNRYGARGITVCNEWINSFEQFYHDMGHRPKGTSIDRIDNNKGYFKENCRWATSKQQNRNTSGNTYYLIDGVKMSVSEAAEKYNINRYTVYDRLKRGWDIMDALQKPVRKMW